MKRRWTQEEDQILIENYPKHGIKGCVDKLNRTDPSIRKRIQTLKLKYIPSIPEKYLKENFEPIVKNSNSINDVCKNIGLNTFHGNFQTVKKYIKLYSIDTSHFYKKYDSYGRKQIPHEEVFCKNSSYKDNRQLKKRLISLGIKEEKCEGEGCLIKSEWLGKKIILQLDHINGDNTDNIVDNLRLLCPNCHSQTNTFAGKNSKREKKKSVKEKKIRKSKCPSKSQLFKDFEELNSFLSVGKKYNVSDNAVRKWCKKLDINLKTKK